MKTACLDETHPPFTVVVGSLAGGQPQHGTASAPGAGGAAEACAATRTAGACGGRSAMAAGASARRWSRNISVGIRDGMPLPAIPRCHATPLLTNNPAQSDRLWRSRSSDRGPQKRFRLFLTTREVLRAHPLWASRCCCTAAAPPRRRHRRRAAMVLIPSQMTGGGGCSSGRSVLRAFRNEECFAGSFHGRPLRNKGTLSR